MPDQTTIPATWLRDGVPDWSAIDREVTCSRCGYDLRTLREPRCPECGLRFDWHDIFDALFTVSPWLFEHQWRRKPIRSFIASTLAALNPQSYWTHAPLHLRVSTTGLLLQLLVSLLLMWSAYAASLAASSHLFALWRDRQPIAFRPGAAGSLQSNLIRLVDLLWSQPSYWLMSPWVGLAVLLFLAFSLLILLSLRQTLVSYQVRSSQLVRVVATCAVPWLFAAWFAAIALTADELVSILYRRGIIPWGGVPAIFARWLRLELPILFALPIWWYSLGAALGQYLRLPRAWLVAAMTTIAAALATAAGPILWFTLVAPIR